MTKAHPPTEEQYPVYHGHIPYRYRRLDIDQIVAAEGHHNGDGDSHSIALLDIPQWSEKDRRLRAIRDCPPS